MGSQLEEGSFSGRLAGAHGLRRVAFSLEFKGSELLAVSVYSYLLCDEIKFLYLNHSICILVPDFG